MASASKNLLLSCSSPLVSSHQDRPSHSARSTHAVLQVPVLRVALAGPTQVAARTPAGKRVPAGEHTERAEKGREEPRLVQHSHRHPEHLPAPPQGAARKARGRWRRGCSAQGVPAWAPRASAFASEPGAATTVEVTGASSPDRRPRRCKSRSRQMKARYSPLLPDAPRDLPPRDLPPRDVPPRDLPPSLHPGSLPAHISCWGRGLSFTAAQA